MANCGTCKFWAGVAKDKTSRGVCHRYPPIHQGFPRLYPDQWCGEYIPDDQTVRNLIKEIDPTSTSFS